MLGLEVMSGKTTNYETIRCHNPEDHNTNLHCRNNSKSCAEETN
jgi:hypothetical protein